MLFCKALSVAIVSLIFASGTGRAKIHCSSGGAIVGCKLSTKFAPVLTPEKFAAVIPDPCSAATTSSRLVFSPDCTFTANNT